MSETDNNVIPLPENNGEDVAARRPRKKTFRKIKVLPSTNDQFYYVATSRNGEVVYTQRGPSPGARRRSTRPGASTRAAAKNFDYILEYENAKGYTIRETL